MIGLSSAAALIGFALLVGFALGYWHARVWRREHPPTSLPLAPSRRYSVAKAIIARPADVELTLAIAEWHCRETDETVRRVLGDALPFAENVRTALNEEWS